MDARVVGVWRKIPTRTPRPQTALHHMSPCVSFAGFNENGDLVEEHGYSGFS